MNIKASFPSEAILLHCFPSPPSSMCFWRGGRSSWYQSLQLPTPRILYSSSVLFLSVFDTAKFLAHCPLVRFPNSTQEGRGTRLTVHPRSLRCERFHSVESTPTKLILAQHQKNMRLTWSVANEVAYMVVDIEVDKYANLVMDVVVSVWWLKCIHIQLTPFHLHQRPC